MSMFDLDECRKCGAPVGHQEDYCENYPDCGTKRVKRDEGLNPPMTGHRE